jgi:hypothetical protein
VAVCQSGVPLKLPPFCRAPRPPPGLEFGAERRGYGQNRVASLAVLLRARNSWLRFRESENFFGLQISRTTGRRLWYF